MAQIVIRLEPDKLSNPDADLRYEIPDMLAERSNGLLADNGYDYELPPGYAMQIYLLTPDLPKALAFVISLLEEDGIYGNRLADGAQVGISELEEPVVSTFQIVYPPGQSGVIKTPEY